MLLPSTLFTSNGRAGLPPVDRKLVAAGLLAGAAVGAWAGSRLRGISQAEPGGVIDWERARSLAIAMNRAATLTAPERARLDDYYRSLVERCVPIVAEFTESELPVNKVPTFAFDRVDWINANLDAFRLMFSPIESLGAPSNGHRTIAAAIWGGVNQTVISSEIGLLLGYLARRVLGQYDLALLGREPVEGGKLYYVEPNIKHVETILSLPGDQFRMWLALHETTHAFEFEANPWVRERFNTLLQRYFEFFKQDVDHLKQGFRGLKIYVERARNRDRSDGSWIEALMSPEQRQLFNEMQAMMCVVEGYSNYVMNAVGRKLLPSYEMIARRFEARQRQRGLAEQLFARLTGLDMKIEQYRLGEQFVARIAQERGPDAVRRIWETPECLPSMAEIRDPALWMGRVLDGVEQLVPAVPGEQRATRVPGGRPG